MTRGEPDPDSVLAAGGELEGLPKTISTVVRAHTKWLVRDGVFRCDGKDCGWTLPKGMSPTRGWQEHLTYMLIGAVKDWYYEDD